MSLFVLFFFIFFTLSSTQKWYICIYNFACVPSTHILYIYTPYVYSYIELRVRLSLIDIIDAFSFIYFISSSCCLPQKFAYLKGCTVCVCVCLVVCVWGGVFVLGDLFAIVLIIISTYCVCVLVLVCSCPLSLFTFNTNYNTLISDKGFMFTVSGCFLLQQNR